MAPSFSLALKVIVFSIVFRLISPGRDRCNRSHSA
jgi:hypothetical protein